MILCLEATQVLGMKTSTTEWLETKTWLLPLTRSDSPIALGGYNYKVFGDKHQVLGKSSKALVSLIKYYNQYLEVVRLDSPCQKHVISRTCNFVRWNWNVFWHYSAPEFNVTRSKMNMMCWCNSRILVVKPACKVIWVAEH